MSKASSNAEIDELLGRLLDRAELSSHEKERLETLLVRAPELLDQFILTTSLVNDLQHIASLAVSAEGDPMLPGGAPKRAPRGALVRGIAVSVLTLAASVAVIVWSSGLFGQRAAPVSPPPASRTEFVATVVSQDNWDDSTTYPAGSRIPTGEFAIEQGVVQLQLDSGPNLFIEGRARLDLKSDSEAHLAFGKLVFRDDSGGDPFHLSTPWSEFVDLGTEYAVAVGDDDEEVHVFSGEVERSDVVAAGAPSVELLRDGQAKRYDKAGSASAEVMDSEPSKFVRSLGEASGGTADRIIASEAFDYTDPATMMENSANGGSGWSSCWRKNVPDMPGHNAKDMALRVEDGLFLGSAAQPPLSGSLGYVGHWLTHRELLEPIDLSSNRVLYLSFLYRPEGMWEDTENWVKVLFHNAGEGVIEHRIAIALDAGRGIIRGALCGARKQCPMPMSNGASYLVVAKLAFSTDNPDQLMIRVFQPEEPVSAHEPASWTVVTPVIHSNDSFRLMTLHFNCTHEQRIDEIRVATSWASVTRTWSSERD
ncbi:MAG: hypothetical protein AAGJ46_13230 [Planctomycetota bacterium]